MYIDIDNLEVLIMGGGVNWGNINRRKVYQRGETYRYRHFFRQRFYKNKQKKNLLRKQIQYKNKYGHYHTPYNYFPKPLWKSNRYCANCGRWIHPKLRNRFRSCETGLNYCSDRCAISHTNRNYPRGKY